MNLKFPIADIILREVETPRTVETPIISNATWKINQNEFSMEVEGIGSFYACKGQEVEYRTEESAAQASVQLYLNGSVFGAILHQRSILPIHGSSFIRKNKGILICGESRAGKSSLTAAFCMAGAQFLTDDVSPIVFRNGKPEIMPVSNHIKLWDNSLKQLNRNQNGLIPILPGESKYYFPMKKDVHQSFPLHQVIIIEQANVTDVQAVELEGSELIAALRNEVYRWEYLLAMPETEIVYFEKLLAMSKVLRVSRVKRPPGISIGAMSEFLSTFISEEKQN